MTSTFFSAVRIIRLDKTYWTLGLSIQARDLQSAVTHLMHWSWGVTAFADVEVHIESVSANSARNRGYISISESEAIKLELHTFLGKDLPNDSDPNSGTEPHHISRPDHDT